MNAQGETLRRALEALDSICTRTSANESSPSLMPVALPPQPLDTPDEWREAFLRWIASDCIAHWRLHGSVGGMHVAFSEWEVGQGEVPCSRAVFERLLLEQGWEIHPTLALVDGLMLRKDIDGLGYFPELLSRQSR
jgi:hypothetical protein